MRNLSGLGMEKIGGKFHGFSNAPDIKEATRDSEIINGALDLASDPAVVEALEKVMDNPDLAPNSKYLIGLIVERFENSVRQKDGMPQNSNSEVRKKELIRERILETLKERHSELIKSLEDHSRSYKNSVEDNKKIISSLEFRFFCLEQYGVDIISDFTSENPKYSSGKEQIVGIKYCLNNLYGDAGPRMNIFKQIKREMECGPNSKTLLSMLKLKGVNTEKADWRKEVNDCDMHDLNEEMKKYAETENENFCTNLFKEFPERVKTFLSQDDFNGIREMIVNAIKTKFEEVYGRVAADTPERKQERILFPLVDEALRDNGRFTKYPFLKYNFHERVDDICRGKSALPLSRGEFMDLEISLRGLYRGLSAERVMQSVKILLKEHGERLVNKVELNYEVANPEEFETLIINQFMKEVEEAVGQIILKRRGKPAGKEESSKGSNEQANRIYDPASGGFLKKK